MDFAVLIRLVFIKIKCTSEINPFRESKLSKLKNKVKIYVQHKRKLRFHRLIVKSTFSLEHSSVGAKGG